ncbi:MAG: glycosyltransferase family 2 protein [Blastocatellia bacterium]
MEYLPISAVIPTRDRAAIIDRAFESLLSRGTLPAEIIVIDASTDSTTQAVMDRYAARVPSGCAFIWQPAVQAGAAVQRNQGVACATQPFICFFDDDILFETDCLSELLRTLEADPNLGGVNAIIVNQSYHPPGRVSRVMFRFLHGQQESSYAGKVIGPAFNLLPENRDDLPVVVPVDWLNLGCTLYRREALPTPPFDLLFTGYSMLEDLTLSLCVAKRWRLANVRTARIFHDSQPGKHKSDVAELARMELVNRFFVMTRVLERTDLSDYGKFLLFQAFIIASSFNAQNWQRTVPKILWGKLQGVGQLLFGGVPSLNSQ